MTDRPPYLVDSLPARADVVIVGAGIVGVSAAYELTQRGVSDVVVVDRGPLFRTGGSTSHAPGGIFQNNGSRTVSKLAQWSVATFRELNGADEGDGAPVYHDVGSIEVATTGPRWRDLHRKFGYGRAWGLDAALLSPVEVKARLPLIDAGAILGGIAVEGDGLLRAIPFVERLAARAGACGARFLGETRVTGFDRGGPGGRVRAVETERGRIEANQVLICAGIWGPVVGEMAGIRIPLQPCAHPYVRSTPLPELTGKTVPTEPLWRHQDFSMYLAQWDDRYVVGSYRHEPLIVDARDIDDSKVAPADLPFDDGVFEPGWREAQRIVPALRGAGQTDRVYGMFSFTPDANSLIGEVASVPGLFLAEAVWVTHGPGAGRLVADLMTTGDSDVDLREVDPNRFASHQQAAPYVRIRGAQNYREVYDVIHPRDQIAEPRGLRRSPFYDRQRELGAHFAESSGWERPLWFEANAGLPVPAVGERDDWGRRNWSPIATAEHVATRERAGLFDLSTFQKIEVSGPGALAALERLSCSVVDRPVGRVAYALFLNGRGGIESDLTIIRQADNRFLLLCGASSGPRDLAWVRRQTRGMDGVEVRDVTSAWCGLGLWGPEAHAILKPLVDHSLDVGDFPLFTSQEMDVAGTPAMLLRLSYVGEYGWEIHVPTEYGGALWDAVWESGRDRGLVACGGAAMDSLRLEKGYRALGTDLRAEYTPAEAGLGFAVGRRRTGYLGEDALRGDGQMGMRRDGQGERRLCTLTVDDGTVVIGKEPVLDGDRVVGYVASAAYGPTAGASIVTAYLPSDLAEPGARLDVEWFGERHQATVAQEPLYDPEGAAMRTRGAERMMAVGD